jgi:hypothetical protein
MWTTRSKDGATTQAATRWRRPILAPLEFQRKFVANRDGNVFDVTGPHLHAVHADGGKISISASIPAHKLADEWNWNKFIEISSKSVTSAASTGWKKMNRSHDLHARHSFHLSVGEDADDDSSSHRSAASHLHIQNPGHYFGKRLIKRGMARFGIETTPSLIKAIVSFH